MQAGAAAAVADGRPRLGSALFCLALNHKQMALYYAPAFFAHLLGGALRLPSLAAKVGRVCVPVRPWIPKPHTASRILAAQHLVVGSLCEKQPAHTVPACFARSHAGL